MKKAKSLTWNIYKPEVVKKQLMFYFSFEDVGIK